MKLLHFSCNNQLGLPINADIRFSESNKKKPIVIFLHGFKSFRNWGFIPHTCDFLANNGYIVVNFDYSTNGIIDAEKSIFNPDLFATQTVSQHLKDYLFLTNTIRSSLDAIYGFDPQLWNGKIYSIGHSMGAALSVFAADIINTDKLVLWASISHLNRNTTRQKDAWQERGFTDIKIRSSNQILPLNYSYITDKESNFSNDAICESLAKLTKPIMIVHAQNDIIVKKDELNELINATKSNDKMELFVIDKTGHTFSVSHPFIGENQYLRTVLNKTLEFLNKNE